MRLKALLCAVALTCASPLAAADLLSDFNWKSQAEGFGGLSGLVLSDDGRQIVVLSDRCRVFTGRILRAGDRIVDVELTGTAEVRGVKGKALFPAQQDCEGLTRLPNGRFAMSFEGDARVMILPPDFSRARRLPDGGRFRDLPGNGALEALASDSAGRLYTLPENAPDAQGRIPVHRWSRGTGWADYGTIPADRKFRPVGADIGPDGRFYLLDRALGPLGFRTRIRRFSMTERGLADEQELLTTGTGTHGNLEGIAVWRDGAGHLRATLVADDNFGWPLRTQLVEYRLPD
ncbi:esterase-like activity of phytase family protein [Chachezhania sediminis]|uniref:esterase-like activity of phytase family protein n=1 Tax=Chachezhania sediminis TaxID=2599291 RepID=UPI00131C8E05|nr:esterase-like activity of phytase family protein [Chachezhania sediminis]